MEIKEELLKYKKVLENIKQYIEYNCVYDNHLQGYCFDLPRGKVKILMNIIKEQENENNFK